MEKIINLPTLLYAIEQGEKPEYLFFWGHRPRKDGQIGKSCFSQWWLSDFTIDGIRYPSAEHYMMAEKARLFADDEMLAKIVVAPDPPAVKKLGRQVRGFDPAAWEAARFDIVCAANRAKFSQNQPLLTYLLSTNEAVIVEASPYDKIWGIGLKADDPRAATAATWDGLNLLGFALMQIRHELRQGEAR